MSVYDLYKPLRNNLRKVSLIPSLRVIWAWIHHLQFDTDFPTDVKVPWEIASVAAGPKKGIFEWELATLAKELVLNAPECGVTDMRVWKAFAESANHLKNLDDAISQHYGDLYKKKILTEMRRHTYHQFGWQDKTLFRTVTRYFKIFSDPVIDAIVQTRIGLSTSALYTIGLSLGGHFIYQSELDEPVRNHMPAVTSDQVQTFLDLFSLEVSKLRELCQESQRYDQDFIYAFNPLRSYPLLRYLREGKWRIANPVPTFLIQRFTEGVYYEVVKEPGFDAAFGSAFQAFIGEVLYMVAKQNALVVLPEQKYNVGKNVKGSADWIVSDETAEIFVECKTKRIKQDAKIALEDQSSFESEISKLSTCVTQIYKTLVDALDGRYSHWNRSARPIYPIVVTLEEWYLFGHASDESIVSRVKAALIGHELDVGLLEEYPFTICSAADFERLISLAGLKTINAVMTSKVHTERRMWLLHGALRDAFPDEYLKTRANLFPDALSQINGM